MTRERWTADGYEITDGVIRDVEYRAGLYKIPAAQGSDGDVSQRTGSIWRPKVHGPGSFTLNVWTGSANRATLEAQWEEILRVIVHPHRQTLWQRTLADGTVRQCYGDYVADMEPTDLGQNLVRAAFEVSVPQSYWESTYDLASATVHMPGSGSGLSVDLPMTSWASATAPMERNRFTITGPIDNAYVIDRTDGVDGDSFHYVGTIPAGQSLTVDSDAWTLTGGGGLTPDMGRLNFTGRRFLPVVAAPRPGMVPTIRLRGDNVTAATGLAVSGRPAFLC